MNYNNYTINIASPLAALGSCLMLHLQNENKLQVGRVLGFWGFRRARRPWFVANGGSGFWATFTYLSS